MISDLFVDTSGWLEIVDQSHPFHATAQQHATTVVQARKRLVTTHLVMIELVALMTSPMRISKHRQMRIMHDLNRDPAIEIVFIDPALNVHAWHLWENRADKLWSMVDCASFVVMQERGLTEALTTDHHFEQAGLVRLLK